MANRYIELVKDLGLGPIKLLKLAILESNSPVLLNSIPKAGTNFLLRVLVSLPSYYRRPQRTLSIPKFSKIQILDSLNKLKKNQVSIAHLRFDNEILETINRRSIKHILVIRDPRDILVSKAYYVGALDGSHEEFNRLKKMNLQERIKTLLIGSDTFSDDSARRNLDLAREIKEFLLWTKINNVYVARYEDFLSPKYGGDLSNQIRAVNELTSYLSISCSSKDIDKSIASFSEGGSKTLRRGGSGSWEEVFTDEIKILVKDRLGDDLISLGYVKNGLW